MHIPASKPFISLVGDQNQTSTTIISGHDKASDTDQYGSILGTSRTATLTVESDYFCATGITIEVRAYVLQSDFSVTILLT